MFFWNQEMGRVWVIGVRSLYFLAPGVRCNIRKWEVLARGVLRIVQVSGESKRR